MFCFSRWSRNMPAAKGKVNKPPTIIGLEGTDIEISKQRFRIGPQIGAGGFGLIYLGWNSSATCDSPSQLVPLEQRSLNPMQFTLPKWFAFFSPWKCDHARKKQRVAVSSAR